MYFLEKLFDINYRISIHEGNAIRRLASESIKIIILPSNEVPILYKKEFLKLRKLLEDNIKDLNSPGVIPTNIKGIRNKTATKYIKLLFDIEDSLRDE